MTIITGGPAFPVKSTLDWEAHGMTLRDYFAIRASEEDIQHHLPTGQNRTREQARYAFADGMLQERMK